MTSGDPFTEKDGKMATEYDLASPALPRDHGPEQFVGSVVRDGVVVPVLATRRVFDVSAPVMAWDKPTKKRRLVWALVEASEVTPS
jgi:hypothetical protein